MIQDMASLLMHAGRPELVAAGLLSDPGAQPLRRWRPHRLTRPDTPDELLGEWGTMTNSNTIRTFQIGTARDRAVELQLEPLADIESMATVNGIGFMIGIVQDLERARIEREERLTLWPVDELPAEDDDSVVAGKMRDVMILARKIAMTTMPVRITGESGTGRKSSLARSIATRRARRSRSSRSTVRPSRKTSPKSHLFGFIAAAHSQTPDRDTPGVIRAANDGTLFLDDIGDLETRPTSPSCCASWNPARFIPWVNFDPFRSTSASSRPRTRT